MSSPAKMMDCEIKINKINKINDAIEMLDEKEAYCWLEKLNGVNFGIVCINDANNVIKDIEKSILELENMKKR